MNNKPSIGMRKKNHLSAYNERLVSYNRSNVIFCGRNGGGVKKHEQFLVFLVIVSTCTIFSLFILLLFAIVAYVVVGVVAVAIVLYSVTLCFLLLAVLYFTLQYFFLFIFHFNEYCCNKLRLAFKKSEKNKRKRIKSEKKANKRNNKENSTRLIETSGARAICIVCEWMDEWVCVCVYRSLKQQRKRNETKQFYFSEYTTLALDTGSILIFFFIDSLYGLPYYVQSDCSYSIWTQMDTTCRQYLLLCMCVCMCINVFILLVLLYIFEGGFYKRPLFV